MWEIYENGTRATIAGNISTTGNSPYEKQQSLAQPSLLWLVKRSKYVHVYEASRVASILLLTVITASSVMHVAFLICMAIRKSLRTPFNLLIIGIITSDFAIAGVSAPLRLYCVITEKPLHFSLCVLSVGFSSAAITTAITLIGIIAATRARAVCQPTSKPLKTIHSIMLQLVAFTIGFITAVIQADPASATMLFCTGKFLASKHRKRDGWIAIMTVYCIGYITITASYVAIGIGVHKSRLRVTDLHSCQTTRKEKSILNVKLVALIIMSYTICYAPSFVVAVISNTSNDYKMIGFAMIDLLTSIIYLHAFASPVIYLIGSTMFRREFMAFIRSFIPCAEQTAQRSFRHTQAENTRNTQPHMGMVTQT